MKQFSLKDSTLSVESPPTFRIRKAKDADIDMLTAIHLRSFDARDHLVVRLGKKYVKAMYKFFINSPYTYVLLAEDSEKCLGLIGGSDRMYNGLLFRATLRQAIIGIITHPWLMFDRELIERFLKIITRKKLFGETTAHETGVGYLAFSGIETSARGMGLGNALYRQAMLECIDLGCKKVRLGARPKTNIGPTKIAQRYGFRVIPELETDVIRFWEGEAGTIKEIIQKELQDTSQLQR